MPRLVLRQLLDHLRWRGPLYDGHTEELSKQKGVADQDHRAQLRPLHVEQQAPDTPPKRVPRLHPRPPPPGGLTCVNLDGCELGCVCGGNVAAEEGEGSPDTAAPARARAER